MSLFMAENALITPFSRVKGFHLTDLSYLFAGINEVENNEQDYVYSQSEWQIQIEFRCMICVSRVLSNT